MATRPILAISASRALVSAAFLVAVGCYNVDEEDAGPSAVDGGVIDLTRDSGPAPSVDAGPPPPDAGPPVEEDAGPPAVQILSFASDSTTLAFLSGTTLRWNTADASSCAISPDIGAVGLPSGSRFVDARDPGDSVTYTLTCEGGGGPASASVTLVTTLVEHEGDYSANSSTELSSLANINVVTGNLRIENAANVTDLSVLASLVRVDGHLMVLSNPALTSVDLPNLERVGRGLYLDGNDVLTTLDLSSLQRIGDRFYVSRSFDLVQSEIDDVVSQVEAAEGIYGPVIDYYNDATAVIGSLDQVMLCAPDGQNPEYRLDFYSDGVVEAIAFSGGIYSGSYERFEQNLKVSFPSAPLVVTATTTELEYDRVSFAHLGAQLGYCYLTGVPGTGFPTTKNYVCPSATADGVEERNEIEVSLEGTAQWTNTRVGSQFNGGQLTTQLPGAYIVDGGWLYFAFPAGVQTPTPVRFPVARRSVDGTQLDVLDLLEGQSPCTAP